jgi:thiamine kinase-like enzyme
MLIINEETKIIKKYIENNIYDFAIIDEDNTQINYIDKEIIKINKENDKMQKEIDYIHRMIDHGSFTNLNNCKNDIGTEVNFFEDSIVDLKNEIKNAFGVQNDDIKDFVKLSSSNIVYSFIVNNQKYVIHSLKYSSIMNWEQEYAAYNTLKSYNFTDELVYYDNGIKITKFLEGSKALSYNEADMIDALDLIRKVHESGVSIKYNYNIVENIHKYAIRCDKESEKLKELKKHNHKINEIQTIINKLNIPLVLCHGDACATTNFLRLPDNSIRIIDWEQAGMCDPLLDIAIAILHQGFNNVDPVWCLHHYLKRVPSKQEYLRLFSFLALDSYALMAWCIYENQDDFDYYLKAALKYSELVLTYYSDTN